MHTGNPRAFRPNVVQLEGRDVPAITSIQLVGGILTVRTDNTDNAVQVSHDTSTVTVLDAKNNITNSYPAAAIARVDVFGGDGNDSLISRGKSGITVRLIGRGGNDYLEGDADRNVLIGGPGNDTLYGRGGDDICGGGDGNDFIFGGIGNDIVQGDAGNDYVNGGPGTDAISGGAGDDVIVSIDGQINDTVDAGGGTDTAWVDQVGSTREPVTGLDTQDFVRAVSEFANGADLTLDGDRIPDPALRIQDRPNDVYEAFFGRPLFPSAGPSINDIAQNVSPGTVSNARLNDGWFLSSLGAMLQSFPNLIKTNVVDFADGTYGVNFNGTFLRIDNDLPVEQYGDVLPAYAKVGPENSLWVPILEKAAATVENLNAPDYSLINGGHFPSDAFALYGATPESFQVPGVFFDSLQLGSLIQQKLSDNVSIAFTVTDVPPANVPLIPGQSYTVVSVTTDNLDVVTSVKLRNPTGVDGAGSTDADPQDGYVTVNIDDLFATPGQLDFGDFNNV
jgi:hypothetical protein